MTNGVNKAVETMAYTISKVLRVSSSILDKVSSSMDAEWIRGVDYDDTNNENEDNVDEKYH